MVLRFGRYEALRRIASGGMAKVYLGRSVGVGGFERLVAIKVMHQHIAEEAEFRSMFLDEARLAARIIHPNVVGVLDVQRTADGMFIIMEYVDGPSLAELHRLFTKRGQTLPIGITLRLFIDVLSGLHDAHELLGADGQRLELIHRDVSPQNILIGKNGVTRLTDFGVARANARITSTEDGRLKGKIAYMSPEQLHNQPLDRRIDIYAAGCVLWESLCGRRLFRSESEAGLVHQILQGAAQPPSSLNDTVPPAIDELVMRSLSVSAAQRQSTAAAFADDLESAAREAGIMIAPSRGVAKFIKSLTELRTSEDLPADNVTPPVDGVGMTDPVPSLPDLAQSEPRRPNSGTTARALVAEAVASRPQHQRPRVVTAIAAMLVALGGVSAHFLLGNAGMPSPTTATRSLSAAALLIADASTPDGNEISPTQTAPVPGQPSASSASSAEVAPDRQHSRSPRHPKTRVDKSHTPIGPGYMPPEL